MGAGFVVVAGWRRRKKPVLVFDEKMMRKGH